MAVVAVLAVVPVAFSPHAIAQASLIYVSNSNDNTVIAVDPSNGTTVATIPVGAEPEGEVAVGSLVYVADINGHGISVIDTTTNSVTTTIPVSGYPNMLALSPDHTRLYAGDTGPNSQVTVISTATNTVIATIPGFAEAQGLAVSLDGTRLYVVNTNGSNAAGWVSVINTSSYSTIATIPVGKEPTDIAVTPDGTKAYVTDNGGVSLGNTVSVIDTGTNTVVNTVTVGINPFGIIMNPAGTRVYVANSNYWNGGNSRTVTGSVSVIDTASDTVTATVPTGYVPTLMTFSPDGSALYVTDANSDYVAAISTATNTQIRTFNAGDQPYGLTFAPAGPPPCPPGTSANFRWHYSASGSSGSWSGTQTDTCPGSLSMGPQAMEGDLKVTPGTTLQVGYNLTIPGNHSTLTLTAGNAQVTFTVRCVSGATPTAATITVTMPTTTTYTITGDAWYPSGDQSSPLVYQGSGTVPDLCGGGQIRLDKGGAFTTTLS